MSQDRDDLAMQRKKQELRQKRFEEKRGRPSKPRNFTDRISRSIETLKEGRTQTELAMDMAKKAGNSIAFGATLLLNAIRKAISKVLKIPMGLMGGGPSENEAAPNEAPAQPQDTKAQGKEPSPKEPDLENEPEKAEPQSNKGKQAKVDPEGSEQYPYLLKSEVRNETDPIDGNANTRINDAKNLEQKSKHARMVDWARQHLEDQEMAFDSPGDFYRYLQESDEPMDRKLFSHIHRMARLTGASSLGAIVALTQKNNIQSSFTEEAIKKDLAAEAGTEGLEAEPSEEPASSAEKGNVIQGDFSGVEKPVDSEVSNDQVDQPDELPTQASDFEVDGDIEDMLKDVGGILDSPEASADEAFNAEQLKASQEEAFLSEQNAALEDSIDLGNQSGDMVRFEAEQTLPDDVYVQPEVSAPDFMEEPDALTPDQEPGQSNEAEAQGGTGPESNGLAASLVERARENRDVPGL